MPIRIHHELPAYKSLQNENIFVMSKERAEHQDIRPLKIIILNIMPKKIETETQLMRLLSNTPLQVDIELLNLASHISKNTLLSGTYNNPGHALKALSGIFSPAPLQPESFLQKRKKSRLRQSPLPVPALNLHTNPIRIPEWESGNHVG